MWIELTIRFLLFSCVFNVLEDPDGVAQEIQPTDNPFARMRGKVERSPE